LSAEKQASLFASPEKRNPVVCLLLAAVTLAIYNPVTHHPFVNYDDDRYVTENPHVRQGLTADSFRWALTSIEQANWHPLTWMSHALDCSLFRLNPAGHHFTSVLLHALNVVLLYLLLIRATGKFGPSLFVAALFALHPLNVESVAWIAERKNVLCTTFFFLTLWAYGWYAQKPDWKRYSAVVVLFAAGLASKPMVITLPFVLLLLDYWPLDRVSGVDKSGVEKSNIPIFPWPKLIAEKLPLLALSAASAVITVVAQKASGAVRSITQFSPSVRIANAIYAYAMYLWKMICLGHLAPIYPHPGDSLRAWQVSVAALVLIAVTAVVLRSRRRYMLTGWLWFLGTLIPVIGLVQVGDAAMADRYAYIPLIGVFVMISFGISDLAERKKLSIAAAMAGAVILVGLGAATHCQISYWQNNVDLWTHALAVTQNNFIAEDNLGGALILAGREEEAHAHFESAARINPKDPMSRSNLGAYFQTHNQLRDAVTQYEAVITLTSDPPLLAQTYANLGAAQHALGEDNEAHKNFEQSLRLNANQFNAWFGMGLLARQQERLDEAITDLSRSVELHATPEALLELGRTLAQAGRIAEAREAYRQALQIDPGFAAAQQAAAALPKQ
jgi:protein O-mannosyl-transferase